MEPVSPASAALLQLETEGAPMHVGWVARLDAGAGGAPLDVDALRSRVAERLAARPRFRRVVARREERSGELVWRDDARFAIERHVAALDAPAAGEEELRAVLDGFLAERLERGRPLWRVLVVPRGRGGGAAIVGTAHRALLERGDAAALRELVLDAGGAGAGAGGDAGGGAGLPAEDPALGEFRTAARIGALAVARRDHGRLGATMRRAAYARTEGLLAAAPPSYLNAADAGARTLVTARLELGRLARIAERGGCELHDVVLAVAAGALRRIAVAAGEPPRDLRALVPLDVREELLGDGPCAVVALPVQERTPGERLRIVHAAMRAAREGGRPGSTVLAGPPEELASRLAIGARMCNLTIPSAAGPARPLSVGGAHVRALFPVTPLPEDHALTISTLSYGRHLHVTAAAAADAIGGVGRLPVMLADAVEELSLATGSLPTRGTVGRGGRGR